MKTYLDTYKRDGVVVIPSAIDHSIIDDVVQRFKSFKTKNFNLLKENKLLSSDMVQRAIDLHHAIPILKDVFCELMDSASEIVDTHGQATLHSSLFFEKGSQQGLHRDTPYFYSGNPDGYLGCWLALEDANESNGTLRVIKKSHKIKEPNFQELIEKYFPDRDVPPSYTPLFDDYNRELIRIAKSEGLYVEALDLKKGDLVIWNPSTLHGGCPHTDLSKSRLSFVTHITLKNQPMMHMDYFFYRDKKNPKVKRVYEKHKGRLINIDNGRVVDFQHKQQFSIDEIGVF